ncbi:SDR family oxidoreductase [Aquicella lusitana]|uniref:Citronellol/citronellal dehydrogenase n=1 Tax=Aquicella lusitana TaxID=254246 RepID=A0A370H432_9COXI|nr:NAD(P)-dependent oxidoreductase [Aquicella lusitana]RDI48814.1 citronellol/citronellal dehydrogenase [Aquicella lusitana]VVC73242.1 putative NAD-dependent oxidoreductase [Aquicella lusitana]
MIKSLKDKVIFITGASRGIGREIALRCAQDGAKIAIVAKTAEPHPTLEGTIYTVAEEIEKAGGQALPLAVDVRDEEKTAEAVAKTIEAFGGIDILINNASAINLGSTEEIPMKRFDLIFSVNVRATFMCSKLCVPHLKKASNPHILNLSPPLSMKSKWFKKHVAYTMSKYGMSMCTLGMSEEFKKDGIAVNSLWPKTIIATAAISNNFPKVVYHASRKPAIVADAAYEILTSDSRQVTGNFFIDEHLLKERGVSDFKHYAMHRFVPLYPDIFVDD